MEVGFKSFSQELLNVTVVMLLLGVATERVSNTMILLAQYLCGSRHFTRLCISVHSWEV